MSFLQAVEKQAARHLPSGSPEASSALLWAWGCFGYTYGKGTAAALKMRLRGLMRDHQIGPEQLLQVRQEEGRGGEGRMR